MPRNPTRESLHRGIFIPAPDLSARPVSRVSYYTATAPRLPALKAGEEHSSPLTSGLLGSANWTGMKLHGLPCK